MVGFLGIFGLLAGPMEAADVPGPKVVLKLDDMSVDPGRVPMRWRTALEFAQARKIKIMVGIICNSLEGEKPVHFAELKAAAAATGLAEFLDHGYDHRRWTED